MRLFLLLLFFALLHANEPKKILVIQSYGNAVPWGASYSLGLSEASLEHSGEIDIYSENMDANHAYANFNLEDFEKLIRQKYKNIKFDAVIADSEVAVNFLKNYAKELFSAIPHIYHVDDLRIYSPTHSISKNNRNMEPYKNTIELAISQNPEVKRVVIIGNEWHESSAGLIKKAQEYMPTNYPNIKLELLMDFSHESLMEKISTFERDALIIYAYTTPPKTYNF